MVRQWNDWAEASRRIGLHGLTPAFAKAIASRLGADREPTATEAKILADLPPVVAMAATARPAIREGAERPQEIEAILNVRPDAIDIRDRYYEPPLVALPLRREPVDLSLLGLTPRDQGSEGSCTGQALAAVVDLQNAQRRLGRRDARDAKLAIPVQVSARMLYESARTYDEYPDDGLPGSSLRGVIKGFYHNGVCDSALAPYFVGDLGWTMTVEIGKAARLTSLGAYYRLRHILNDYHAALSEVEAVLCSAIIHEGWSHDAVDGARGTIRMAKDPKKRKLQGAHAFAIVGYDRDGFYVLNSWGTKWGGCSARRLLEGSDAFTDIPQPGIAHWSYEDWQNHVLDAWVLRLAAPFPQAFGMTGGYVRPQARSNVPTSIETREAVPSSTSRQQILGHYIHLDDGRFVPGGAYPNSLASIKETADYLRGMDDRPRPQDRYDHVVFYAHGGLNSLQDAASRTAAMVPAFKRNGVYPMFFIWRTGLAETIADIARSIGRRIFERAGGVQDLTDTMIESVAQRIGRPIWDDMKEDALRCFGGDPGDGWGGVSVLLEALAARKTNPVKVHFIGHSAGAILLAELFNRAGQADHLGGGRLGTVSLMAPACRLDVFDASLSRLSQLTEAEGCATYILPDRLERQDGFAGYGRSLLYLISNGLEGARRVPVAGMERYWAAGRPGWKSAVANPQSRYTRATSHSGFDNDPTTMNSILSRIRRRTLNESNGGFTAADLTWE